MTIICAVHQNGQTWFGADSRITSTTGVVMPVSDRKWEMRDGCALGVCGDSRTQRLVRRLPDFALPPDEIADAMKVLVQADGYLSSSKDGAPNYEFALILARTDGIWDIDGSCDATRIDDGRLWARGSGFRLGLGADHVMRAFANPAFTPKVRIETAIAAAIEYDTGCGGDVFVQCLSG